MGLFGKSKAEKDQENRTKAAALTKMITDLGFKIEGLKIDYFDASATVMGTAQSEEDKKRIVLAVKGQPGVEKVNDLLRVAPPKPAAPAQPVIPKVVAPPPLQPAAPKVGVAPEAEATEPGATTYTVKPGDTLSKIAKVHYGDASKYMVIFEANQPMLKDPNKIFPGQVLRIPPLS